jgi:hypothetical protein
MHIVHIYKVMDKITNTLEGARIRLHQPWSGMITMKNYIYYLPQLFVVNV